MRQLAVFAALISLLIAACQPSSTPEALPTQVEFPTETNTPAASDTLAASDTPTPTDTPEPTETASNTPTETFTPTVTNTPTASRTPTETPDVTIAFSGTSTAVVMEAPRFSTLTPLPSGAINVIARPTSTGTPEVLADVIITRNQFQEEVDRLILDTTAISRARVTLVEHGVSVELTAENNGVFVTGIVLVPFTFSGGSFNNILIIGGTMEIEMLDGSEPSEDFILQATNTVLIVQEAFNFILNQRLGEGNHDLEAIIIRDGQMLISLLVPQP